MSSQGVDSNPYSITAPCRGFAAAIAQASPGSEVIVLDSAAYGVATVSKAIKITAPSVVYAGITVFAGDGRQHPDRRQLQRDHLRLGQRTRPFW